MIEARLAGGKELYDSEKEKYFQSAWSGLPFKNEVYLLCAFCEKF